MVEICSFFPNWLKSHNITIRLVTNGLMPSTMAHIISALREPKEAKGRVEAVTSNYVTNLVKKAMTAKDYIFIDDGYVLEQTFYGRNGNVYQVDSDEIDIMRKRKERAGWSFTQHDIHNVKEKTDRRDPRSLKLSGKLDCAVEDIVEDVTLVSLANGVKHIPSLTNGDGLDFTRVMQLVLQHPKNSTSEDWIFKRDYQTLFKLIGNTTPDTEHYDSAAVDRYKNGVVIPSPHPGSKNWMSQSLETLIRLARDGYMRDGLPYPNEQ